MTVSDEQDNGEEVLPLQREWSGLAKRTAKDESDERRRRLLFAVRQTLAEAEQAGIGKGYIGLSRDQTQQKLEEHGCHDSECFITNKLAAWMYEPWAVEGTTIVIHGGSPSDREGVADLFLFQALKRHFDECGVVARKVAFTDIAMRFNSFREDREELAEELKETPCLAILEVDEKHPFRDAADGRLYFENVLRFRENKLPTVITLCQVAPNSSAQDKKTFLSPEMFGETFKRLITSSPVVQPKNKVWKIRLS